jgi:hypothetical protein
LAIFWPERNVARTPTLSEPKKKSVLVASATEP